MTFERLATAAGLLAARRPWTIVLSTLLLTLGLGAALASIPAVPSGDAFAGDDPATHAEARIAEHLPPTGFSIPFLVGGSAANDHNALSRAAFDEILARERTLRADPVVEPLLFTYTSPSLQIEISSVWALPDTLQAVMDGTTPLSYALGWHADVGGPGTSYAAATDREWQDALTRLLEYEPLPDERPFLRQVSVDARQVDGVWHARTLFVVPAVHHGTLFDRYARDPADATPERPLFEDVQLHVADHLRETAVETEWIGLGLGINAEIAREVAESGRLVVVSFLLIGVLLFLTLRNLRDFLVAYLTLPVLIVWMLGGARLLGLSVNQFTAMLPVLILALGVDFAIHGIRRYREERAHAAPEEAVRRSVRLVGPALLLAAGTTATAFFSNAFSRVDALRDWGIQGGIAILSALWLCGVFAPAVRYLWDRRRVARGRLGDVARSSVTARRLEEGTLLGRLAVKSATHPTLVLAVLFLVTVPAAVAAVQITSDFNADDFLDPRSELVVGATRVQEDFPSEGEPAILLIEGDLADPLVLKAIANSTARLAEAGYKPEQAFSLLRIVETVMRHPEENEAVRYVDRDGDLLPDRRADLQRLYAHALTHGVHARVPLPTPPPPELVPNVPYPPGLLPEMPDSERVLVYGPETVRELLRPDGAGGYDMTVLYFGIPGTADFAAVRQAVVAVPEAAAALYALQGGPVQALTLTGEPLKRLAMVNAITDSLKVSITISVVLCFLIVLAVLRDVSYALVTTLPVVVLVVWLFAFMVLAGMSLNLVTVTVAAMAIGVGIDYSIHITERFREEARRNGHPPLDALRRAMDSSGVALLGSAITTITGFLVLTFAPMPLFATFGLITAAMAGASFLAAATILPPLLVVVEAHRRRPPRRLGLGAGAAPA